MNTGKILIKFYKSAGYLTGLQKQYCKKINLLFSIFPEKTWEKLSEIESVKESVRQELIKEGHLREIIELCVTAHLSN